MNDSFNHTNTDFILESQAEMGEGIISSSNLRKGMRREVSEKDVYWLRASPHIIDAYAS